MRLTTPRLLLSSFLPLNQSSSRNVRVSVCRPLAIQFILRHLIGQQLSHDNFQGQGLFLHLPPPTLCPRPVGPPPFQNNGRGGGYIVYMNFFLLLNFIRISP